MNAAELSFSNTNGNLNVNFTPNIERVLTTSGNNTSVANIELQTTAELEAVSLIDQVADLPVVSFPYGTYLLRPSGASTPTDIPIEIPVPIFRETVDSSELDVGFVLEEKDADGNWQTISMTGDSYTIRAGEQPSVQAVAINVDRRIRLFSGAGYVLGEHSVANALSTEATDEQNHKLTVRMLWLSLPCSEHREQKLGHHYYESPSGTDSARFNDNLGSLAESVAAMHLTSPLTRTTC